MPDFAEQSRQPEQRASGNLSEAEFEAAKVRLSDETPSPQSDSPSLLVLQNELAALEREWTLTREKYQGPNGPSRVPALKDGPATAVRALVSGLAFTVFTGLMVSGAITAGSSRVLWIFPAFGVLIMISGAASLLSMNSKANALKRAETTYQAKRAEIEVRIREK